MEVSVTCAIFLATLLFGFICSSFAARPRSLRCRCRVASVLLSIVLCQPLIETGLGLLAREWHRIHNALGAGDVWAPCSIGQTSLGMLCEFAFTAIPIIWTVSMGFCRRRHCHIPCEVQAYNQFLEGCAKQCGRRELKVLLVSVVVALLKCTKSAHAASSSDDAHAHSKRLVIVPYDHIVWHSLRKTARSAE